MFYLNVIQDVCYDILSTPNTKNTKTMIMTIEKHTKVFFISSSDIFILHREEYIEEEE
jgi:hypothetical protein